MLNLGGGDLAQNMLEHHLETNTQLSFFVKTLKHHLNIKERFYEVFKPHLTRAKVT